PLCPPLFPYTTLFRSIWPPDSVEARQTGVNPLFVAKGVDWIEPGSPHRRKDAEQHAGKSAGDQRRDDGRHGRRCWNRGPSRPNRSEEHTSELQSQSNL